MCIISDAYNWLSAIIYYLSTLMLINMCCISVNNNKACQMLYYTLRENCEY